MKIFMNSSPTALKYYTCSSVFSKDHDIKTPKWWWFWCCVVCLWCAGSADACLLRIAGSSSSPALLYSNEQLLLLLPRKISNKCTVGISREKREIAIKITPQLPEKDENEKSFGRRGRNWALLKVSIKQHHPKNQSETSFIVIPYQIKSKSKHKKMLVLSKVFIVKVNFLADFALDVAITFSRNAL